MIYDASNVDSLLSGLNEEQRQAATHMNGPLLVLAGAGTGKTKVLIHRIAHLLSQGVPAKNILALTFTRKAGNEMRERIASLVGVAAEEMRISTFHALGLSILREHYQAAGLPPRFGIANRTSQVEIAKEVIATCRFEQSLTTDELLSIVSDCKNSGECVEAQESGLIRQYDQGLRDRGLIDFDDMVAIARRVLESSESIRNSYRERFRYLLVDEFQDTNALQFRLLNLLLSSDQNLFVVGDDDQSIYGFRGAARKLILNFGSNFPHAKMVVLTRNYRCSTEVVRLANAVIAKSATRYRKTLRGGLGKHGPVELKRAAHSQAEFDFITRRVATLQEFDIPFEEMGILVRVNSQLRDVTAELKHRNIPVGAADVGVRVMTLHAAKGLQFLAVFLPGLEEQMLPHWNAINTGKDAIEEERRLFYVGVTRAKQRLFLSWCDYRGGHSRKASPFLAGLRLRRLVKYEQLR